LSRSPSWRTRTPSGRSYEEAGASAPVPRPLRFAGRLPDAALGDFARLPHEQFLRVGGSPQAVIAAYATDHGRVPGTGQSAVEDGEHL